MQLVRPRGTLVLKSTYQGNLELNAAPIVIDEITIVCSRFGPFEPAISTLENNLVRVDALIDQTYPFSQALQAFEAARELGSAAGGGRLGRAHTLRALGRSTEAVEAYQQCIAENSGGAAPWWGLASLRTYSFSEDELRKMRSVKTSSVLDKAYLDFAMGKALEDRGEFDLAWR